MSAAVIVYIFRGELKGRSIILCHHSVKNLFMSFKHFHILTYAICIVQLNFVLILFHRSRSWSTRILPSILIIAIKIELILSSRELSVYRSFGWQWKHSLKKILDSTIILGNVGVEELVASYYLVSSKQIFIQENFKESFPCTVSQCIRYLCKCTSWYE